MKKHSILLLAGEASADHHAAALVQDLKEIRPNIRVAGIGGDKLAEAGMELLFHYRDINTIGLSEGLARVRTIIRAYRTMKRELQTGGHDLFIPVDYPDVNLRLCRFAKDAGVHVCYYISPQVWAWRRGRIRKIASRVDHMMTIFPFEEKLYRQAGVRAEFVGHTMVRDISAGQDKQSIRRELGLNPDLSAVALVPGSRPAEVRRMLPVMCRAAQLYLDRYPDTQFLLPLAGPHLSDMVEQIVAEHHIPVSVHSIGAARIMAACDSGLVTSGTATLQAALVGMPHVVGYILDGFSWFLARRIIKPLLMDKDVHVAMANVLAISREKEGNGPIRDLLNARYRVSCHECGRPLFVPELLQRYATAENMAKWLVRFRADQRLRAIMISGFQQIRAMLAPPDEGRTPAKVVLSCLER